MQPIPQHLIESALALTGKTMEDISETKTIDHGEYGHEPIDIFCDAKFFYYLLSPEFVEKYGSIYNDISKIGIAIYEYQSGNPDLIISLLSKI